MSIINNNYRNEFYVSFGGKTYLLIGTTGSGKTTFITIAVDKKANHYVRRMIGNGSATIKKKLLVITDDPALTGKIRICSTPNEMPFERRLFDETIVYLLSEIVIKATKNKKDELVNGEVKRAVSTYFLMRENHVSLLKLLDEKLREKFINDIASSICSIPINHLLEMYSIAKNTIESGEKIKGKNAESSKVFKKSLKEQIEKYLDGSHYLILNNRDEVGDMLNNIYVNINKSLYQIYELDFEDIMVSTDGYNVVDYDLDDINMDSDAKLKKFFASNDKDLSIEVLCEEIIVYLPMSQGYKSLIEKSKHASKYMNAKGHYEIAYIDTMGTFHKMSDKEEVGTYFEELYYNNDFDGIIVLRPLMGDTNEKKFIILLDQFLKQLRYDTKILILNNKLDMLIDDSKKEYFDMDVLSDGIDESETDHNAILSNIKKSLKDLEDQLCESIDIEKSKANIVGNLACAFKSNQLVSNCELYSKYRLPNVMSEISNLFNEKDQSDYEKVHIKLDSEYEDIILEIDKHKLTNDLTTGFIKEPILKNIEQNIDENLGKSPHGNGFYALVRRLNLGQSYTSAIRDDYFKNVESFSITFPGTLYNSYSKNEDTLYKLLFDSISIQGALNANEELIKLVLKETCRRLAYRKIISLLVYDFTYKAITKLPYYSYELKFNKYLLLVKKTLIEEIGKNTYYSDALIEELQKAFKSTIDKIVIYEK